MHSSSVRRKWSASVLASLCSIGVVSVFAPSTADAHFKITDPTTPPTPNVVQSWMSQDGSGSPQKNGPCAATPNTILEPATTPTPTHAVTVVQSGQKVTVPVTVTIGHPGWFRIALVEGPSSSQTLATLADPKAAAGTNCTPAIMANPVWSPTQPILADGLPAGSTATTQQTGVKTFQVTIPPSANCTPARPCTLQVIMVMTDHPATDCYYHHCADISLASAGGGGSGGASAAGGAGAGGAVGGSVNSSGGLATAGSGVGGGASTSSDTGGGGSTSGSPVSAAGAADSGTGGSPNAPGTGGTQAMDTGMGGAQATNSGTSGAQATDTGTSSQPASGCSFVIGTPGEAPWAMSAAGVLGLLIVRRRRRSH
jgi:MYXO-CTERM domain-containing protein